jgi:hypothetical protein
MIGTHLISLMAPVWSSVGMSTLSPYLRVSGGQTE